MKNKIFNQTHIEGYLYQHKLEKKVTGPKAKAPNTTYITGTIDIATDNEMTNIVTVHYSYQTATTKSGKENRTFTTLANIIDGKICSVMEHGKDKAQKFVIDSALDVNEWYAESRTNKGEYELASYIRNENGFISPVDALNEDESKRATFETDIIINKATRVEADPEKDLPEKVVLSGYIMNFRQDFMPISYTVLNPGAMDYFESLDASNANPVFTKVCGKQVSTITVRKVEEEGAFGETYIREYTNSHRDFVVNWAKKDTYEIGDGEDFDLSKDDIKKGLANRETTLAAKKEQAKERATQAAAENEAPSAFANSDDNFGF